MNTTVRISSVSAAIIGTLIASQAAAVCPHSGNSIDFTSIPKVINDGAARDVPKGTTFYYDDELGAWSTAKKAKVPTYNAATMFDIRELGVCLDLNEQSQTEMYINLRVGSYPLSYAVPNGYAEGFSKGEYLLGMGPLGEAGGLPPGGLKGAMVFSFVKTDELKQGAAPLYHFVIHFDLAEGENYATAERFPSGFFIYQSAATISKAADFNNVHFNPDTDTLLQAWAGGGANEGENPGDNNGGGPGDDQGDQNEDPMTSNMDENGRLLRPNLSINQDLGQFTELTGIGADTAIMLKVETHLGEWNAPDVGAIGPALAGNSSGGLRLWDKVKKPAKGNLDSLKSASKK